ncbi:MAG TPA: GDYXXLXY domain-containing protein [Chitinispirillaceae bacterium]|nr:GDYXXLXY domain-containing protein [Chitinispirillaceae bacterium]
MNIRKIILLISVLFVFIAVGTSVKNREDLLDSGEVFLFRLAPVDPRSILQGDYMTLNYRITSGTHAKNIPSRGYIVFQADSLNIADRIRFQEKPEPLNSNERIIKYYAHKRNISIGSESFFFQEGDADLYAKARFGGIKVAKNGTSILFGLFDANCKKIEKN